MTFFFFFLRQKTQIVYIISVESACIEELFQMGFENATGSIFICTKPAPQPSSEATNCLTSQIASGLSSGEEKPKIYRQWFPNRFIVTRAKANQETQGTRTGIHTQIARVRTLLPLVAYFMDFVPGQPIAEFWLPSGLRARKRAQAGKTDLLCSVREERF